MKDGAGSAGYEYLGSLIYRRTGTAQAALVLESAAFGGGRISVSMSGSTRVYAPDYHITDHLGSVRVVFRNATSVSARNDYHPFGKRHNNSLLPAGLDDASNRWLYNGKERQTTGDLRFLDYGARMYDPEIARFGNFDPLGEDRRSMTPFAYAANNPANLIDLLGLSPAKPNRTESNEQPGSTTNKGEMSHVDRFDSATVGKDIPDMFRQSVVNAMGSMADQISSAGRFLWDMVNPVGSIAAAGEKLESNQSLNAGDVAGIALDIAGFIPGVAAIKGVKGAKIVAKGGDAFFEGASYSKKVLEGMDRANDLHHAFPSSVDGYARQYGKYSTKIGSDGNPYHWLEASGSYGGKTGTFEYIKNPRTGEINHRFFNTKGK